MFELVSRLGSNASHVKEVRIGQCAQRLLEIVFRYRMDRTEQFVGKLPATTAPT